MDLSCNVSGPKMKSLSTLVLIWALSHCQIEFTQAFIDAPPPIIVRWPNEAPPTGVVELIDHEVERPKEPEQRQEEGFGRKVIFGLLYGLKKSFKDLGEKELENMPTVGKKKSLFIDKIKLASRTTTLPQEPLENVPEVAKTMAETTTAPTNVTTTNGKDLNNQPSTSTTPDEASAAGAAAVQAASDTSVATVTPPVADDEPSCASSANLCTSLLIHL